MSEIPMRAVTMPKWGMEGGAGKVTTWLVAEGVSVESGVEVVEVETEKSPVLSRR